MYSSIYWIDCLPARLGIMARPRSGDWLENEINGWMTNGIGLVVSLLEPAEIAELALEDEPRLCAESALDFFSFPIPDRGVPDSYDRAAEFISSINSRLNNAITVAIHCRAGIGRSALFAACLLVSRGMDPAAAFSKISEARGLKVPDTEDQRRWVEAFARRARA